MSLIFNGYLGGINGQIKNPSFSLGFMIKAKMALHDKVPKTATVPWR
jgi:hypothetical protein